MGGTSSKQDALIGNHQSEMPPPQKEQQCFSCFQSFFCPPDQNSNGGIGGSNDESHAEASSKNSSSYHHSKTKSFGTPVFDTPENVCRIRKNIDNNNNTDKGNHSNKKNGHYHNDNDEKEENKMAGGGGSFGRTNNTSLHEVRSSRYGGLEKEYSGMFSYENSNNGKEESGRHQLDLIAPPPPPEEKYADIHDGEVSSFITMNYARFIPFSIISSPISSNT